jgi:hypothetical protein
MTKLLKIGAFAVPACAILALAQPAAAAGHVAAAASSNAPLTASVTSPDPIAATKGGGSDRAPKFRDGSRAESQAHGLEPRYCRREAINSRIERSFCKTAKEWDHVGSPVLGGE